MRQECIEAVIGAIGRPLRTNEAEDIERAIRDSMASIAKSDPQAWAGMSKTERYTAAADNAAKGFMAEAQKKASRTALNITARAKLANKFNDMVSRGTDGANSVERILNQVNAYVSGVQRENFSMILDTVEAAEPKFFGWLEDVAYTRDFVREVFAEGSSGNASASKAAKAWLEGIEVMRQRFNKAGGDIGKLSYGYLPQVHDAAKMLKAGKDAWMQSIAPKLDRTRYVDDFGNVLNDTDFMLMLNNVYETLSTGGINKLDPERPRFGSSFANRGSQNRAIHFKDAESFFDYQQEFGKGTLFEAMQHHVNGISRNTAIIEEMGSTPKDAFDMLYAMQLKTDGKIKSVGAGLADNSALFRVVTGESDRPASPSMADINQGIRNFVTAVKLQGTLLSSVTDMPALVATSAYHKLPIFETLGNVFKSFGKEYKDYANIHGLIADSMISDMNRWAHGNMSQGWTSKLAQTTMKVQLLTAWTESLKRGFQISMMGALAKMTRTPWDKLPEADRARLQFQGVTPEVYAVWQKATPEDWRGSKMLTPESIRAVNVDERIKQEASSRFLAYLIDESEYAVTTPDLTTRASLGGALQKGTAPGEIARHLTLFKSFPLAMANRHIRRMMALNGEGGSPLYSASLIAGLVGFGALSLQLKDLAQGKDPADMTDPKFWGKAMSQSGGLSIYGDVLYTGITGQNKTGQANWTTLLGPVFGTAADGLNVSLGNLGEAMRGERTKADAELVRFAKGNTPFINLWYARSAIDHMIMHDIQESVSPGYLGRMKARAYEDFGQRFWWEPGESMPDRAPDFANAIGE